MGVALVVLDKKDYTKKVEYLLGQQQAYMIIPTDPTTKWKHRLINLLKNIKTDGGLQDHTYRKIYCTGVGLPKFCGIPKFHKTGTSLRLIVFSRGTVTSGTAKELTWILRPLIGKSLYIV